MPGTEYISLTPSPMELLLREFIPRPQKTSVTFIDRGFLGILRRLCSLRPQGLCTHCCPCCGRCDPPSPLAATHSLHHISNATSSGKPSWTPSHALPTLRASPSKHPSSFAHLCVCSFSPCLSLRSKVLTYSPLPRTANSQQSRVALKKACISQPPLRLTSRKCGQWL